MASPPLLRALAFAAARVAATAAGPQGPLPWVVVSEAPSGRASDPGHQLSTFRSGPISLDVGRVVLTPPKETPLRMPPEPFVLTSLHLEVVRAADGQSVPLTEVYNHHVALYADGGKLGADLCGGAHLDSLDSLIGLGAEARGTSLELPEGFALPGAGPWLANIHLIRSEGVPDVKRCIECTCEEGGGSEDCCRHGSLCPGFPRGEAGRNASDVKEYALQYTIGWSPNASLYTLAKYMTLDATGCQLEFQIPARCPWMWRHDGPHGPLPGAVGLRGSGRSLPSDFVAAARPPVPECVARVAWDYELPPGAHGEVIFSKGHVHIGGLNVSAYVLRQGTGSPELLCASTARYGRSEPLPAAKAGDELGYVVGMSSCRFGLPGQRPMVRPGDRIRVEAAYRTDLWFNGVMGLLDLAVAPRAPDQLI